MKLFAIIGWKNSGKTGLVERLVSEFGKRSIVVSTIKHAHHAFSVDRRGTDSFRHKAAGAREVLIVSNSRWAMVGSGDALNFRELFGKLSQVDLVLMEGFKNENFPKLEAYRSETRVEPIARNDRSVLAVASDVPIPGLDIPVIELDDTRAIANFVLGNCRDWSDWTGSENREEKMNFQR
ncbi:MAG: molybdopterin-guanine dinucleotide biosynthesis protein B [Albidovulum sp.]|nr:molybdopterin-guanine dinucleotide biosynthesis protein B [Albidovulum sp.]